MGTKVQFESYLPRYYPMRNLNEDTSSSQSHYYEDEAFNRQLFIDIKPTPMCGHSGYDKEMLKRTMLEHEAIFRKQVYELHRLYRVQKDMMDMFKKKQSYKFCERINTTKASMFMSQMPPEAGERALYSPQPPSIRNHYSAVNLADTDDKRAAITFLKEVSIQHIPTSTDNGRHLKSDRKTDLNSKSCKRTFDLHLPADVYIESDESELTEKQNPEPCVSSGDRLNLNSDVAPESEINLTLATANLDSCRKDNQRSDLQQKNDRPFHGLADLNEPCNDLYEEISDPGSSMPKNLKFHSEDNQRNPIPTSNSISLQRDFLTGQVKEEGICSSYFSLDKGEHRRQRPLLHESGARRSIIDAFDSGTQAEKYPMSSESIQLKLKKAQGSYLPDKNKSELRFGLKVSELEEMPGRNPNLFQINYSGHSAEETVNKLSYISSSMNPTSSLPYSSWKTSGKINHVPIAVQALPCFTGQSNGQSSVIQNQSNECCKMKCNGNLKPHHGNGNQSPSYANSLNHGFPLESRSSSSMHLLPVNIDKPNLNEDGASSTYENSGGGPQECLKSLQCIDIKCAKDLDMNSEMLNTIQFGHTAQEKLKGKHEGFDALHWLKKPTANENAHDKGYVPQVDPDFANGYAQQVFNSGKVAPGFAIGERDKGISTCALQNPISSFKIERKNQRYEISHSPNNKEIANLSLHDKMQQSFSHIHGGQYQEQLLSDNQKCTPKGKGVRSLNIAVRKDINLNSSVIAPDDSYFPGMTVTDEELPSAATFACNTAKLTCKIDLEAPVEVEHNNATTAELVKMNRLEGPIHFLHKDNLFLYENLTVAASTIVSLSRDAQNLVSAASGPFVPASCDSLRWFAELVTSNTDITGDSRGQGGANIKATDDEDGSDSFESMTLKLEELKEDEYLCRPYEYEIPQDDDKLTASLLFTKTRRGQARKRRQRKDFQRDILPTIASLSRQEVVEDLYSLGGLPKSSSKSRNTSSGRRGTGRNNQTRGRKPRSMAATIAEVPVSLPPMQSAPTDLETDGSIKGWGRTTRRCRRQRTQLIPSSGLQD